MAKYSATIIAIFFCLFTLSLARTQPENDDVATQLSLPLSEANPMLRLSKEPVNTEIESNSAVVTSVPLIKSTFRAVNRRFDVRSKHPCRQHFKVYPRLRVNEEIPYGNDMIVASGENSDFEDPVLHGEGQRIPVRWVRLHHHHHHHDEDSDSDDEEEDEDRIKKITEKKLKVLKKLRKHFRLQNGEEEKEQKDGFMKRVRKFLDHYF